MFWSCESKRLYYQNKDIKLTRNEVNLLELFVAYPNRLFSDEDIIDYVWKDTQNISPYSVKNLIKNLRKKLPYNIIENSYGLGYKLIHTPKLTKNQFEFLSDLREISITIQENYNSNELIKNILDKILNIFDCDRVFLLYPLDINIGNFQIPYKTYKSKYVCEYGLNSNIQMNPTEKLLFEEVLNSKKPVYFGREILNDISSEFILNSEFIPPQSALIWKIKPLSNSYWGVGLQQCSHDRKWNEDEIMLFEELAMRLCDALNISLLYENMQNPNNFCENLEFKDKQSIYKSQNNFFKKIKFNVINELLSNIAHQWRQPLNVISLASSGVKLKLQELKVANDEIEKSLSAIEEETMYLSETIEKFYKFFQNSTNKQYFYISTLINETISLINDNFKDNGINILIELENDFQLNSYLNDFRQVIYYILINAKEALLKSTKNYKKIKITSTKDENDFLIIICDNGAEIRKDIVDKICEPYFSTKFPKKDVGLSLYICKIVIENSLKGKLLINSDSEKTEFIIKIPQKISN